MNKEQAFNFLCRTAEGIAIMFGSNCETLVHDMSVSNHPILAINNGHVSRREVGSTVDILGQATDVDATVYTEQDYINHLVITPSGQRVKSSTFHYSGDDYHFALGINFDFTDLAKTNHVLVDFMTVGTELQYAISEVRESHLTEIFDECVTSLGIPLQNMDKSNRLALIALLNQNNVFNFQKSVPFVAEKLNISRYTVYKYINEVNDEENKQAHNY